MEDNTFLIWNSGALERKSSGYEVGRVVPNAPRIDGWARFCAKIAKTSAKSSEPTTAWLMVLD